jgi:hypothetical protein
MKRFEYYALHLFLSELHLVSNIFCPPPNVSKILFEIVLELGSFKEFKKYCKDLVHSLTNNPSNPLNWLHAVTLSKLRGEEAEEIPAWIFKGYHTLSNSTSFPINIKM